MVIKKLIDRIREEQVKVEASVEAEAARRELQAVEHEKIQRQNGRASAYDRIPHIDSAILEKVKKQTYVYSDMVVERQSGLFGPYWEAYTDYLIDYFRGEGITVRLAKTPIYHAAVVVAHTYTLEFSWLHA
jgi:hypothetical protein